MAFAQCLFLILVANGAPVLVQYLLGDRLFNCPVDAGAKFLDGRPLLGPSKTARGVLASVFLAALAAPFVGVSLGTGAVIGLFAMLGDLLSSFIKRRLGIPPSDMALGLDQIPESLLPSLAVRSEFGLRTPEILGIVAGFVLVELLLSRVLYRLQIRRRPY